MTIKYEVVRFDYPRDSGNRSDRDTEQLTLETFTSGKKAIECTREAFAELTEDEKPFTDLVIFKMKDDEIEMEYYIHDARDYPLPSGYIEEEKGGMYRLAEDDE